MGYLVSESRKDCERVAPSMHICPSMEDLRDQRLRVVLRDGLA